MSSSNMMLAAGLALECLALFAFGVLLLARTDGSTFDRVRMLMRRRPANPARSLQHLAEQASQFAERSLDASGRRGRLETALEHAGLNVRAGEFIVLAASGAFAALLIGAVLAGPILGLAASACVLVGARMVLIVLVNRRHAQFESQLEQTLPLMAGSLRAGFGVMQSLDAVARESESPTAQEFSRLVMESRLGRDLGASLHAMSDRVQSEDFDFVVQAIEIHRETGGDLAQVLDNVGATIRDRNKIRRQIQTLTAEGRISAGILLALPIVMFFVVQRINPGYLHELTGSSVGRVMLGIGAALMTIGAVWMRRLVRLVF